VNLSGLVELIHQTLLSFSHSWGCLLCILVNFAQIGLFYAFVKRLDWQLLVRLVYRLITCINWRFWLALARFYNLGRGFLLASQARLQSRAPLNLLSVSIFLLRRSSTHLAAVALSIHSALLSHSLFSARHRVWDACFATNLALPSHQSRRGYRPRALSLSKTVLFLVEIVRPNNCHRIDILASSLRFKYLFKLGSLLCDRLIQSRDHHVLLFDLILPGSADIIQ